MAAASPDLAVPRSAAQIAASRANGAKSRGPRTDAGKAASCQNAVRHGLRAAAFALLPDEDGQAFEALVGRLTDEHDPHDAVEEALVMHLASILWRMERVEALEVEALTTAREPRFGANYVGGFRPGTPALWAPERLNTLLRYRAQLERDLHLTLAALDARRAARTAEENYTNEPEPPARDAAPADAPAARVPPTTNEPHERTRAGGGQLARLALAFGLVRRARCRRGRRRARIIRRPSTARRSASRVVRRRDPAQIRHLRRLRGAGRRDGRPSRTDRRPIPRPGGAEPGAPADRH